ncbi:MAG TPA: MBL fold metallo-hydrolase [Polyangia bacterium]|nr:MBL fold metallo-hydrolase [Polyangia bacterium]
MRAIKNLFALVIIVAILSAGAVVAFRVARGRPSVPEQIKPDIMAVSSAGTYLYAARAGSHVLLFDAGADPAGRGIDDALSALHAGRGDVSDLFVTHAHPDHLAGAAGLGSAKVHLGEPDVAVAEGRSPPDKLIVQLIAKATGAAPVTVSAPLTGVAAVDVGGGKLVKALPVPGHTPGSYVFLYDGVLFVGDTMTFKEGRLDRGPSLFDSDGEQLKASVRNLKSQLAGADIDAVCAGHGGCTPVGLGRNLLDDFIGRLGG